MPQESISINANELFRSRYEAECNWVHSVMTWIMFGQWLLGIAIALFWSPYTWMGQQYDVHIHVWAAIGIGSLLSGVAIGWIRCFPSEAITRQVVAIAQVLWSALLIHLSGGRIETHFHVFVSIAILSAYRDWKILVSAAAVVAADHFARGVFFPASVFGTLAGSQNRWIEHTVWVIFEIAFLAPSCYRLRVELKELCVRQAEFENARSNIALRVQERTKELRVANDMLEAKTAEAQKLAIVARHTDNAVLITDRNANVEWANDGFARISGFSRQEAIGSPLLALLEGAETERETVEMMQRSIERKVGFNTELKNRRKDGEEYWLAIEVRPITDRFGNFDRFIAIQSDVTERKSIELSLATTEALLRSIVNRVPGAFYRREIKGDRRGQTTFISDFIQQLTGHAASEFVALHGLNHQDFVHPDDLPGLIEQFHRARTNGSRFEHEYRIVANDKTVRWVSEKGNCYQTSEAGESKTVVDGMLFDITSQVEAELHNQQLQSELLDASRQAGMAEIATGVLHNVGNILNSVNVSTSVIQKQYAKSALANLEKASELIEEHNKDLGDFIANDERGRKFPAYIQKVTKALSLERQKIDTELAQLVKNVDHIKEIVCVQQSMAKSSGLVMDLNPAELLHDAYLANKASLLRHEIRFEQSVDSEICGFKSDKHRILQILINVIKNAKDALKEKGPHEALIQASACCEENNVIFSINDNGIGIPKEKLDKIFQHGFTTKVSGHGFGLHSSANGAAELGGRLSVSSEGIGKGATFKLTLPLEPIEDESTRQLAGLA